jgi:hypothetical protein
MPKKLPLGLQDFRGIIKDGYKYVDKTRYLHQLATSGKYFSCPAPAAKLNLHRQELLDQMREWYNGYRFEESAEKVYNPMTVNIFFDWKEFENFWFATGTPTVFQPDEEHRGLGGVGDGVVD